MSDPLAWNGTTFKRPKFWTGTEWKAYVDPIYNVPVSQYEFSSGPEGWTDSGDGPALMWSGDEGGFIYSECRFANGEHPSGIYMLDAGAAGNYPPDASRPLDKSKQYRQQVVWRAIPLGGTYPPDYDFSMRFVFTWDAGWWPPSQSGIMGGFAQGVDTGWQTYNSPLVTTGEYKGYLTQAVEPNEGYMDNYGDWQIRVYSAKILDQYGNPAMALGNVPWEPKVFRTNGTWK